MGRIWNIICCWYTEVAELLVCNRAVRSRPTWNIFFSFYTTWNMCLSSRISTWNRCSFVIKLKKMESFFSAVMQKCMLKFSSDVVQKYLKHLPSSYKHHGMFHFRRHTEYVLYFLQTSHRSTENIFICRHGFCSVLIVSMTVAVWDLFSGV